MPFKPGQSGNPAGKPKGPNKATSAAREAIAAFVEGNTPRLQGWLDQVAADPKHGPLVAIKCVTDLLEYHVPKLARTELSGKDGAPLIPPGGITFTIRKADGADNRD